MPIRPTRPRFAVYTATTFAVVLLASVSTRPAMTPAMQAVLTGQTSDGVKASDVNGREVPKGGCQGHADLTLSDIGPSGEPELFGQVRADSFSRSLTDPVVTAAFRRWSGCMSDRGYHYAKPLDAGSDLNIATPTASANEIAIATADVECKKSANLFALWSGFETNYQNQQIELHAEELKRLKSAETALLGRVSEIIAASSK